MKNAKKPADVIMNLFCCMYTDCDSEYSTKFNLKRHVESVHMHVKRYKCAVCCLMFASKQSLKEHLHIHTGAMPFKCDSCDKNFRQASQLSLHKRIHIVEGQKSSYSKVKIEDSDDIVPIEICMEVDKEKFKLPEICGSRIGFVCLPAVL